MKRAGTAFALAAGLLAALQAGPVIANPTSATQPARTLFSSGPERVELLELYTSEGCSSCPPADRWLSALRDDTALWNRVVPLAFHVTYWDRLGWPDRFAQPLFDLRQRTLAARLDTGVYTPGVFRNGQEFRRWRRQQAALPAAPVNDAGQLTLMQITPTRWRVRYSGLDSATTANLAVLSNGERTRVRRGENGGRELRHDFIVGELHAETLVAAADGTLTATFETTGPESFNQPAVAAWVSDGRQTPLQATGGFLP